MRVAIACCGLEHVRRGYESFSRELFDALRGKADVVLFKGSGRGTADEIVVPCLRRDFLIRFMNSGRAFYWEQITFALALIPLLIIKRVDVLHFSEGNLGNALSRLLRWTGIRVKLVQSNGGPHHPRHFRPEVFIHQVCKMGLDQALECGVGTTRMSLVPYGIDQGAFEVTEPREKLRQSFEIPLNSFVVLSIAALNKRHKRIDYLIREVAGLKDESVFLCMAGEPTDESDELRDLAAKLLPGRHVFMSVRRERIPNLLACADVFVHTALHEGFGMVLIEACSARIPVICHDSAHFRWVLGDAALYADMTVEGALTGEIRKASRESTMLLHLRDLGAKRVEACYDWRILVPHYLQMYKAAMTA